MAKTNADYQREHRERRTARLAELLTENAALRAEIEAVRARAEAAEAEVERLSAPPCLHPSGRVEDGVCQDCGEDVW